MKDAIGILLRAGADPSLEDNAGNSAASLAVHDEVKELLARAPPATRRRFYSHLAPDAPQSPVSGTRARRGRAADAEAPVQEAPVPEDRVPEDRGGRVRGGGGAGRADPRGGVESLRGERDAMAKVLLYLRVMSRGWDKPRGMTMGSDVWWRIYLDIGQGGMGVLASDFDGMFTFNIDGPGLHSTGPSMWQLKTVRTAFEVRAISSHSMTEHDIAGYGLDASDGQAERSSGRAKCGTVPGR
ncbi:hypothetical protein T484DRAFT_1892897 [Baffinella frigidus]|nr:hypothetical protein T484DRAFT_1892897 [Cryptophyta sp. CCMP2293]